ncbi:unnamed protein product, partial [Allacma fusca]
MTSKYFSNSKKESARSGFVRKRALLQKFDPTKVVSKKTTAWSDWSFFESPECVMIDSDIHGRMHPNPLCDN